MSEQPREDPPAIRRVLRRREFLAATGVAGLGLVAACGTGGSAPSGSAGGQAGSAPAAGGATAGPEVVKVRVGVIAGLAETVFQYLGQEQGFFRDEGIDVEFTEFQAGGPMIKALIAGELELAEGGFGPLPVAVAQGAEIKLIGASKPGLNFALYTKRNIDRLEDLYGKTVGIADPGSFVHQLMVGLLEDRGLDPTRVEYANIGSSPAIFRAVLAGKVDAGPSQVDWIPEARRSPDVKVLLSFDEYLPRYVRVMLMARDRDIQQRPDMLVRTLTAWARSSRYSIDHRDEWLALAAARTGRPQDELEFTYDYEIEHKIVAPNLGFDADQVRYVQEMNVKTGAQREVLPFDKVATLALQQQVVAKLGTYDWKA
jgi:NitT/TauT family transport system substrate-binding protein